MSWLQLIVDVAAGDADRVADALTQTGASAVTFQDAGEEPVLEPGPGETPLWSRTRVVGLFPAAADRDTLRSALAGQLGDEIAQQGRFEILEDQAWERAWLTRYRPMRFGERLWICPSGVDLPEADDRAVVITLDPGLAFGTGTHPTTALCLEWLDTAVLEGTRVLDYGCGSGILAIAAAKLGAARVDALDIDPQAVRATRANAAANGVAGQISVIDDEASMLESYDVVIANILAEPLIRLAPTLSARVVPGGRLVLSGLLGEQRNAIEAAYADGFTAFACAERDGWIRLEAIRR